MDYSFSFIEKKNPLKQGLKLSEEIIHIKQTGKIEKKNPLKQGLKHIYAFRHNLMLLLKRRIH